MKVSACTELGIASYSPITVMAGLVPAIQDLYAAWVFMGGRDKPGHDVLVRVQP